MTAEFCPIQFEGDVFGYPAYFRARHGHAFLNIVKRGSRPICPEDSDIVGEYESYCDSCELEECRVLIAGWIDEFRKENEIVDGAGGEVRIF